MGNRPRECSSARYLNTNEKRARSRRDNYPRVSAVNEKERSLRRPRLRSEKSWDRRTRDREARFAVRECRFFFFFLVRWLVRSPFEAETDREFGRTGRVPVPRAEKVGDAY